MVKTVKILSAFVASPSDVTPERQVLTRVMDELNVMWGSQFQVRLEIVKWETHVRPMAGTDSQAVINSQIGADCDVFIGIIWSRIGTPTPRGRSGTVEEFERAHERLKSSPGTVEIMMYFKNEPIAPNQLDPAQLKQVQEFRSELEKLGVLYSVFNTTNEFEQLTRIHLSRVMGEVARGNTQDIDRLVAIREAESPVLTQDIVDLNDPDIGYLDLDEAFASATQNLTSAAEEINRATQKIGVNISQRANDLPLASKPADQKQIVELAARDNE